MLRKVRQILALVFFLCITLLFLDFTGTVHAWFGWMAKIQFMPALFAANAVVLVFLFGFICGKCSSIGILVPAYINTGTCILFRNLPSWGYAGCGFSHWRDA